ncbi:MAG: curli assembly protein CsgG [Verrucomicrobia bacterium]|nr:curli assembly protein CsgG [Verrucomicrobiota bacterium]
MKLIHYLTLPAALMLTALAATAKDEVLTVAVFNFESTDEGMRDLGAKVAALINADLSADARIITVERAELEKALGEQEMGLSGTIQPETVARVGHLTGAKVLVTGKVFKIDRETIMVAKVIGTETSRVYGETVKAAGDASPADMASQLAKKIAASVSKNAETLVAKAEKPEDRIERIQKALKGAKLPVVEVHIPERHFGGITIDPAAQTEISFILEKCGFKLLDEKSTDKAEIEFKGEALSEFGMRKGNLVSCKGRVELKIIQKASGKILAVDRQTSVAVDLSEQIAAKAALQRSAQELAERMIPKAVK